MTFALVFMEGEESRMDIFQTIESSVTKRVTVAIVCAADQNILLTVKMALDQNICSFLLFGDKSDITRLAGEVNLDLNQSQVVIVQSTLEPEQDAITAIHQDQAQLLMKGNISTKALLKAVLNNETGLRTSHSHVLSHVALFEIPAISRPLLLTDAAMNIKPTLQQKVNIINNVVKVAHAMGIKQPKVAILAAVEVINEAMPSTLDAAILTQMSHRGQITNCLIDGPLALDVAISKKAAQQKNIRSQVAGEADVLLVPELEVGNALYKSFVYLANARVASVISGAQVPIVLTSRADSSENKLSSLLLALAAL